MINILIVDDDTDKVEGVRSVIYDIAGTEGANVSIAGNYVDACEAMENTQFEIAVIDLLLPRDATSDAEMMGLELLDRLSDPGQRLLQPRSVVGLTAFDDLQIEHKAKFEGEGFFLLQYSHSAMEWRQRLSRIVVHAAAAAQGHAQQEDGYKTDLVLITAMTHVEQEQLLKLPLGWTPLHAEDDDTVYYRAIMKTERGDKTVVAGSAVRMGMPATAALSMKMICRFRPKYIAMCGIAAGVKGRFGDILIADQTWDYGSGKNRAGWMGLSLFDPAPEAIPLDHYLRCRLAEFRTRESVLNDIRENSPFQPDGQLTAQIGPLASGAAVLENRWLIETVKRGQRKVIGIEMEAYGVFMAAEIAPNPKPKAFVVKSICDFGDERKGDEFQPYAAYTSASFVYRFALEYL